MMNIAGKILTNNIPTTNKAAFWREHAKHQKLSGLSRISYCKKNQLSYDQFDYWDRKSRRQQSTTLLPVYANVPAKINADERTQTLCTLAFKNGHELKIHDKSIVTMLLSVWG